MNIAQMQQLYVGNVSEDNLILLAVGLCVLLAAAGWVLIAEPVKHVKNTHYATKRKVSTKKPAKRKPKKK